MQSCCTGSGTSPSNEVPDAGVPGPDGLLLRVDRTAICGSDLHLYHGPMTVPGAHLGHEFVGTVEEVGPGVAHRAAPATGCSCRA